VSRNLFNGYLANIRPDKFTELHDENFGPRGQNLIEWSKTIPLAARDTTAQPQIITQKPVPAGGQQTKGHARKKWM
jgi:hypothetical protein